MHVSDSHSHRDDDAANAAMAATTQLTIGVLALQGAFIEHIKLLELAATDFLQQHQQNQQPITFSFIEVRNPAALATCDALIIPGGESTSMALIAERTALLEPLRDFVKLARKPVWGTCAGLILLAEEANRSKATGQQLIGGLDVRVQRNFFGRQVESFEAELALPAILGGEGADDERFHTVFIRAPVVEKVLDSSFSSPSSAAGPEENGPVTAGVPADPLVEEADGDTSTHQPSANAVVSAPAKQATKAKVEVLGRLPGRAKAIQDQTTSAQDLGEEGDIVAVRQGNVFGTAFHPELTGDARIHGWWLGEVVRNALAVRGG
ncbi:SNO glutamine amidotransferase [Hortaea werneckii]|nr:SNO glutamine amidotransferase [Hortaea werneckii]KAI7304627.1 SNO glutamine amidotransferase [Hortaea werneckii]